MTSYHILPSTEECNELTDACTANSAVVLLLCPLYLVKSVTCWMNVWRLLYTVFTL